MDLYTLWIIYSLVLYSLILIHLYYTSVAFYTLSYIYSYILHIPAYFTPLLYTLIYTLSYIPIIYLLIYSLLLFPNSITNLAPPFLYLFSLIYYSLIYLPPPFFITLLYTLYCPSSYILLYPLSYMEKGITTLPPIFTRFTSLS